MKPIQTVTIVGVGLIGGSVGLALRKRGLADRVVGVGRRASSLRVARDMGAVHTTTTELAKGVAEAELVLVCTPVSLIAEHARQAAAACREGTLLTDVGSAKARIVAEIDGQLPRRCRFLGSHPIAGGDQTGPANADAELFEGRVTVLTPTANTRAEDFDTLEQFWSALGSVVVQMPPDEHDRALAQTSHLPHVVAAALAAALPESLFRLAGTGFADTTRIAGGSPELWVPILLQNQRHVLAALERFEGCVEEFRHAIRQADRTKLEQLLLKGQRNRDALGD